MASTCKNGLRRQRRITIRDRLVVIFSAVAPTPFAAEAPCRHGVRRALVLAGWRWPIADAEAALLTRSALQIIGAKRPSWREGQPEYTQPGVLPIMRERCVRCAKPLPEGHYKYCGDICAKAAKLDAGRRWALEQASVAESASHTIKRQCPSCRKAFLPRREEQRFCSTECAYDARRAGGRQVRLVCEGI